MAKITEMYAFVMEESPGEEGVMAARIGEVWIPLVGADMARVNYMKSLADKVSQGTGKSYKILKFELVGELIL